MLKSLGSYTELTLFQQLFLFVASGDAGPTGRPISLLSFYLNDTAWPSEPFGFKLTNLLFHCLNGLLVLWLVFKLLVLRYSPKIALQLAFFTSLLWMLHPLQLTTVTYVVQRMTELSALFSLSALISYLFARQSLARQQWLCGYSGMFFSLLFFGILAVLSKENGALLVLYALVLEWTLLQQWQPIVAKHFLIWRMLVLVLPSIALLGHLVFISVHGYTYRPFDLTERLLTETRVVSDYLRLFLMPRISELSLYHDDYQISHSLLDPPQTLLALLFLTALVSSALLLRRRLAIYAFGLLWFFAGHLMESTVIPLELYFEHRNYLPLLGPCLILVTALWHYQNRWQRTTRIILLFMLLFFAGMTRYSAWLVANPLISSPVFASEHPYSERAQQAAINVLAQSDQPDAAWAFLIYGLQHQPKNSGLLTDQLVLGCEYHRLTPELVAQIQQQLKTATFSHRAIDNLFRLYQHVLQETCTPLTPTRLHQFIDTLLTNQHFSAGVIKQQLYALSAQLLAAQGQLAAAVTQLKQAFGYHKTIDIPLYQAAYLASDGQYQQALEALQQARQLAQQKSRFGFSHPLLQEIERLEQVIRQDCDC